MTRDAEEALLASVQRKLFIGGEWVDASGGATFPVIDPATGKTLLEIADATPEDGIRALDAAVAAQDEWAATAPRTRSNILRRAFDIVQERREDLALIMTLEMGKPLAESRGEVTYGSEFLRWFSEEAVRISGRYGLNPEGTGQMLVTQRPVGPSFFITPWNFPLAMATRKIAPALAAGCTVVIKPAALTPLTTILFTQILEEAGLPAGVVNVLTATRSGALSAPIIADPGCGSCPSPGRRGSAASSSNRAPRAFSASRWNWAAMRRSSSSKTPISTRRSMVRCSPSSATSAKPAPQPTASSSTSQWHPNSLIASPRR